MLKKMNFEKKIFGEKINFEKIKHHFESEGFVYV